MVSPDGTKGDPAEDAWFYKIQGRELGPVPLKELCRLATKGRITDETFVRRGTGGEWVPFARTGAPAAEAHRHEAEGHEPRCYASLERYAILLRWLGVALAVLFVAYAASEAARHGASWSVAFGVAASVVVIVVAWASASLVTLAVDVGREVREIHRGRDR